MKNSKEILDESLGNVFRALNTMDGLIDEIRSVIPDDVMNDKGPEDCDEVTAATFGELQELRWICSEIISDVANIFCENNGDETAAEYIDELSAENVNIDKKILEILEKYKGDTVSDEY